MRLNIIAFVQVSKQAKRSVLIAINTEADKSWQCFDGCLCIPKMLLTGRSKGRMMRLMWLNDFLQGH